MSKFLPYLSFNSFQNDLSILGSLSLEFHVK